MVAWHLLKECLMKSQPARGVTYLTISSFGNNADKKRTMATRMRRRKKNYALREFLKRLFANKDLLLKRILVLLVLGLILFSFRYAKQILSPQDFLFYRNHKIPSTEGNILEQFHPEEMKEIYADGIHKTYYPSGALQSVFEIKKGQYEGIRKSYSEYGVLLKEESYQTGNYHGVHKMYTLDGKLQRVFSYARGKKEGKAVYYYLEGGIRAEELYKDGKLEGLTRYYFKNGQLMAEINFVAGKPVDRKQYYQSGILWRTDSFAHKKVHGLSKFYYETGQLLAEVNYELGTITSIKKYDKKGKIAWEILEKDKMPQKEEDLEQLLKA